MYIKSKTLLISLLITVFLYGCKNLQTGKTGSVNNIDNNNTDTTKEKKQNVYHSSKTLRNNLLHTKLNINLDWENQYVNGLATLTFKPWFYPQDSLILDAQGFEVDYIKMVKENQSNDILSFNNTGRKLKIALDKTYTRHDKYKIKIQYTAKPNELETPKGNAITENKGFYFINPEEKKENKPRQFWTQGEPEANSCWFPTIDSPNEKTTQEIYLRVDSSITTLSNGEFVYSMTHDDGTRTDYWRQKKPHPPYLIMVAGGNFKVVNDQWRGMSVNYYVEPEYHEHAEAIFGDTPEMLSFFSKKFGYTYPWKKYSSIVVRDFVSGAMENTTATVFMEDIQSTKRELIDKDWENIIAHELSHHWFGNIVTCESWANLPLNESFATYSEYLWAEYKHGKDAAAYIRHNHLKEYLLEAQTKKKNLIRYHYKSIDDMFDRHSYSKGATILHMLRKYLGDDAFFYGLKKYLYQHEYKSVEIHDLRLAFEDIVKEDLNWFFNQWFLAKGHPVLKVEDYYKNGKLHVNVEQKQDTSITPVYRLPLKLAYWHNGKKYLKNINIDQMKETFTFKTDTNPELLIFDYEQQLTGIIKHDKSIEEYALQYKKADRFDARHEAIKNLSNNLDEKKAYQTTLKALNDDFWVIRKKALTQLKKHWKNDSLPENIIKQVKNMAFKDKDSKVRTQAIELLISSKNGKTHKDLFRKRLNDSSWLVTSMALKGFLKHENDTNAIERVTSKFENTENKNIVTTLSKFYAKNDYLDKYSWFKQKFEKAKGMELLAYLESYSLFLQEMDKEEQQKGIQKLKEIAHNHNIKWVRVAAYRSLGNLTDIKGVKDIRKNIRESEEDEKVKQIYKMLP